MGVVLVIFKKKINYRYCIVALADVTGRVLLGWGFKAIVLEQSLWSAQVGILIKPLIDTN